MNVGATRPIPHWPGRFLLGALPDLQRDPVGVMTRATLELGGVVHLPLPRVQGFVLGTPALAEHALVTNVKNYAKQTRSYQLLRMLLGNGLVTSEGAFWKRQRRIAQPAFHRERLAGFGQTMVTATEAAVRSWPVGQPFDFGHEMMRLTLRIVGETLLSADVMHDAEGVGQALTTALEHLIYRTLHPFSLPEWVPTAQNRAFAAATAELDRVVRSLIAARRDGSGPKHDLLAMLMEATDPETGERMDDGQLRDEVMTIFLAGHETTANLLTWTLVLLGRSPEVLQRLHAEYAQVLGGRAPEMSDLPKLAFTSMVVKESLRLYPPVWTLGRLVQQTEEVEGWRIPEGALVFICPYALHRLPSVWDEPEAFLPDRWASEDPRRVPGSYLPFSMGQRKCIGDTFALVEAQLLLATMLQRVSLSLVPGQDFTPEPLITLRPKHGVKVVATPRQS